MNKVFFVFSLMVLSLSFASPVDRAENSSQHLDSSIVLVSNFISTLSKEVQKQPESPEDKRLINTAKRLLNDLEEFIPYLETEQVPGFIYYEGDNYLANVIVIAEKLERVHNALKYIKKSEGIDQKVQDYFQNRLIKLQSGINAPLPDYFYGFDDISETLQEQNPVSLKSVYGNLIQYNDPYTHPLSFDASKKQIIAIDEGVFRNTRSRYHGNSYLVGDFNFRLIMGGPFNLQKSNATLAFVIAPTEDVVNLEAILEEQNLDVPVLTSETARAVISILEKSSKRQLPSFTWFQLQSTDYLTQALSKRTQEGVVEKFKFGR